MKMGTSQDGAFNKLSEQFRRFYLRTYPVTASFVGVHDYDEELFDFSPSGIRNKLNRLEYFKKSFKSLDKRGLSLAGKVDLELILNKIETELVWAKKFRLHNILPDLYLNEILFGVYVVISRDFAPVRERALSATRRLAQVQNILRHARKNLKNVPPVFIESALHTCAGATVFFLDSVPDFAGNIRGALMEALLEVNDEAIAELKDFASYLEETMLPKSKGNFAVGKTIYNQLLRYKHQLSYKHDDLLKIAKKNIKQIEAEMNIVAGKITKNKSWKDVVSKLKDEHPSSQGLVGAYRKEMRRARQFVIAKDLATIPEGEEIEVMPTPPFAKALTPYAAYLPPAPLDEEKKGSFWITVPTGMPRKEAKERLKGHPKWRLAIVALHEAYPGHHLHLVCANEGRNLLHHLIHSPVTTEGWAFYCEEMMWETGFYGDPKQRLLQLKDALWRAHRVIIDVGLHTKTMKLEEAVKILVDKAGLEQPNAEAEVRRYCQNPTQPMSYLIGKVEILNLLQKYRKKKGKSFKLKEFHDRILSHGTIPVASIETLLEL